jgi:DNA-binding IscR family transcriptional regulator
VSGEALDTLVQPDAGVQLLALLKKSGGILVFGQRSIAAALGWSKSWTNMVLHELARAGLISVSTGKTGTVVRLFKGCVGRSLNAAA